MRRTAVGIIALVFLAIAGYGFTRYGLGGGESSFFWSCCWRMGLVLGCLWFALPKLLEQEYTVSPLALTLVGSIVLLIVVRPKAVLFLWPVLVILAISQFFRWLIKPPPKKKQRQKQKQQQKK